MSYLHQNNIQAIYATLFTHIFGNSSMDKIGQFESFSTSLFTMFQVGVRKGVHVLLECVVLLACVFLQVMTGDSWATGVTRPLFEGETMTNVVFVDLLLHDDLPREHIL